MISETYLIDCMEFMRTLPDKFFDLAIVDPPYGIDVGNMTLGVGGGVAKHNNYIRKDWDLIAPNYDYFIELFRVSINQIVWGANHYLSKTSPCWLVWNKENGTTDYADCELAWTSFKSPVRMFSFRWSGMLQGDMKNKESRIHPTQKPVALYKWLLTNYAKPGDKILDTHAGSCSSVIAFIDGGFDWVACELDKDYYEAAMKRIQNHVKQTDLFNERKQEFIQPTLL